MGEIQSIDVWILVITGISVLLAYSRGFTAEMLKMGVYVLSAAIGVYLAPFCAPAFESFLPNPNLAIFVSFFTGSLLSWIVLKMVASQMAQAVRQSSLRGLDKSLGIVFGLFRGVLMVLIFYLVVCLLSPGKEAEYRKNSRLFDLAGIAADTVRSRLIEELGIEIPQNPEPASEEGTQIQEDDFNPEDGFAEDQPPQKLSPAVKITPAQQALMQSLLEKAQETKIKTTHGEESLLDTAAAILLESYSKSVKPEAGSEKLSREDMIFLLKSALEGMSSEEQKEKMKGRWQEKQEIPERERKILLQQIKEKQDAEENTRN